MRIAVYLTGEGSDFCLQQFGSYADLCVDLLAEPGTCFDVYDNQAMQFPEDPGRYDTIVLTGSAADAHGDDPWIGLLNASVADAYRGGCKIVGICFGHQAVANALGGRSDRNDRGWELGTHPLTLHTSFHQKTYTEDVTEPLHILEIHRDHVVVLPPGAEVLASTPSTPVQMYAIDDQVLCMQGHPEFFNPIVDELVRSRMAGGTISEQVGNHALASLAREPDRGALQRILKSFVFGPTTP